MEYTLPTLVLLLIITVAFFSRRRLPTRRNVIFAGLLAVDFLTMVADVVSTKMDEAGSAFPDWSLWLANYLFFVLFIARSFYFFQVTNELLGWCGGKAVIRAAEGAFCAEQALLLVGSLTGWVFSIRGGVYASGPAYCFLNLQFAVWILLALWMTASAGRKRGVRRGGIYAYLGLLLGGVVLRVLLPHVVIMNLFCLFAIQTIYLFYLNPVQYLDDVTSLFNERGWHRVLEEAYGNDEFSVVGFGIRDFLGLQRLRGSERVFAGLERIGRWVRESWPQLDAFYLGRGLFVLSSMRPFDQEAVAEGVARRFREAWSSENGGYYLGVNVMLMEPGLEFGSRGALRGTVRDALRLVAKPEARGLLRVDANFVREHLHRREVQSILAQALANDGLEMFLQPIVRAGTGELEGAEALCRLPDGKGGYVFPDEFIPLALSNGSIGVLGRQMFRKACEFMAHEDVRRSVKWVNVNVAPEQLKNPDLMDCFEETLAEYHLESSCVHLEITEESMIDRSLLHDAMARFCEHGFVFSMDDFGSSYSNMIRLQQNHFSSVKIDRDFTWCYFDQKTALLPDVIKTCHDLGMTVVAEGVETQEMADGMREIGADYIQGYYYSKPIPVSAFAERYVR